MRKVLALALGIALCCIPSAFAQEKKFRPPEIKKVHVGFKTYKDDADETAYKVGLWTPIYIQVFGGTDGILPRPNQRIPYLQITTGDSDDVETLVELDCVVEPMKETTFLAYVKTGHLSHNSRDIKVTLTAGRREIKPQSFEPSYNANVDAHLYLTLGPRITDFHRAVTKIGKQQDPKDEDFRNPMQAFHHVAYESDVDRLPDRWIGYQGVDLLILGTDKKEFLTGLNNSKERLRALAQWVRRGGRIVVPIAVQNQDAVHAVLKNEFAWQPAIPVIPPKASTNLQFDRLTGFENWVGAQADAFEPKGGITVATLDPGNVSPGDWKVLAESGEKSGNVPLIAQVRYGLGQITYMAISLQDEHLFKWTGKEKFMQAVVSQFAPKTPANIRDPFGPRFGGRFDDGMGGTDPATQLLTEIDKFGVTPIDFGYVALFIILYILIVGPLDFFLLKFVFKRLEWTWITFPAVVLAVSVIAYFAAYALKGKDLKINKVDIVDFDLRTSRDAKQAKVYGNSFFAILSPRIQNYTIGVEPNPAFWGEAAAGKSRSVDMLTWLGRPSGGPGDMGRSGSGGFFRRPYEYTEDYAGLRGVPIPVWTTKAFTASWEQSLASTPFVHELTYFQNKDIVVAGKLENHLAVDLVDVWLFYDDKFYPIDGGLKSVKNAPAVRLELRENSVGPREWVGRNEAHDDAPHDGAGNANQTRIVKSFLFHERIDTQRAFRNHLLRPLDMGWRITEEPRGARDQRVREAILFGRVRYPTGSAEAMTKDASKPLPTNLWLGDLPGGEREWPGLSGQLNQDTYIRVVLPVRPDAK